MTTIAKTYDKALLRWIAGADRPVTISEAAAYMGGNLNTVTTRLRLLRAEGLLDLAPSRGVRMFYRITAAGRTKVGEIAAIETTPERFKPKPRTCLACRNLFKSEHAGNRICDKCKDRAVFKSGDGIGLAGTGL